MLRRACFAGPPSPSTASSAADGPDPRGRHRVNHTGRGRHHANPIVAGICDIDVPVPANRDAVGSVQAGADRRLEIAVIARSASAGQHHHVAGVVDASDAVMARVGNVKVAILSDGHRRG